MINSPNLRTLAHRVPTVNFIRSTKGIPICLMKTLGGLKPVVYPSPIKCAGKLGARGFHQSAVSQRIVSFNLADIGEGITECELIQWFVKPGDDIAQFDRICEVQSDKASVEITSRFDGKIHKLHYEAGAMALVGKPLVDISTSSSTVEEVIPIKEEIIQPPPPQDPEALIIDRNQEKLLTFAAPAVRRIARESNLDLSKVAGTGKAGRILKEDVLAFIKGGEKAATPLSEAPKISSSIEQEVARPLTAIQKAMLKAMTQSLTIPHFGYSDEVDLTQAAQIRAEINAGLAKHSQQGGGSVKKISYMPLFIKALSVALADFPLLNARLADDETLMFRSQHNVSVAMDTPNGLLVPCIKDVQSKSIVELGGELNRLQELGQKNALSLADLKGGTITLSNIGNIGGTYLSPVLVKSQLCIGGLGRIQTLPRYKDEILKPTPILPISWSADHRVVDGATMARFSERWRFLVENPTSLLAHLK